VAVAVACYSYYTYLTLHYSRGFIVKRVRAQQVHCIWISTVLDLLLLGLVCLSRGNEAGTVNVTAIAFALAITIALPVVTAIVCIGEFWASQSITRSFGRPR
jgi:hypothetical protein